MKYTSVVKRVKYQDLRFSLIVDNDDNSRKTNSEFKNVILDIFDQIRKVNTRNAEKDRMIATLTRS